MDGFTLVDAGVGIIIFISAILAYSRGLVREILSIAGWVAAAIIAFIFAPNAEPLIKEIPVVRDIIASCELSILAAFAGVFTIALIVVSFFTPLFASMVQNSAIGGLDRGLGFLFGVARGILLVAIALILYNQVIAVGEGVPMVEDSRSKAVFSSTSESLMNMVPEDGLGWITSRYEMLTGNCGTPGTVDTGATSSN